MPDSPGLELILAEINQAHPGAVIDTSFDREQPALIVNPALILEVLTWLKETPGQEYTFMSSLHGADYFPAAPRFAVHYELMNRERHERLRVKALVADPEAGDGEGSVATPDGRLSNAAAGAAAFSPRVPSGATTGPSADRPATGSSDLSAPGGGKDHSVPTSVELNGQVLPVVPSCVQLYPTAEFQEREVFDFFGIVFDGHPDPRRILMPEDYVGWPQRRDFPVGGEPVIFTRDEVENPGWWK